MFVAVFLSRCWASRCRLKFVQNTVLQAVIGGSVVSFAFGYVVGRCPTSRFFWGLAGGRRTRLRSNSFGLVSVQPPEKPAHTQGRARHHTTTANGWDLKWVVSVLCVCGVFSFMSLDLHL